jgi:hypothetical protein
VVQGVQLAPWAGDPDRPGGGGGGGTLPLPSTDSWRRGLAAGAGGWGWGCAGSRFPGHRGGWKMEVHGWSMGHGNGGAWMEHGDGNGDGGRYVDNPDPDPDDPDDRWAMDYELGHRDRPWRRRPVRRRGRIANCSLHIRLQCGAAAGAAAASAAFALAADRQAHTHTATKKDRGRARGCCRSPFPVPQCPVTRRSGRRNWRFSASSLNAMNTHRLRFLCAFLFPLIWTAANRAAASQAPPPPPPQHLPLTKKLVACSL